METGRDMELMESFSQARTKLADLRNDVWLSNQFAYDKLRSIDNYLALEQKQLGEQMFREEGIERRSL